MMDSEISASIPGWLAAAFLALTSTAIGIQLIIRNWRSVSTESALLKMMHDELERMSTQNSTLSQEIGKLQIELVKLSSQLTTLTIENQKLQEEVSNLNKEIVRLHGFITTKESL